MRIHRLAVLACNLTSYELAELARLVLLAVKNLGIHRAEKSR